MKRKIFTVFFGVCLGIQSLSAGLGVSTNLLDQESATSSKPNVLIIHTDEQSWWTLSAYGGEYVKTPHLDSLAKEGAMLSSFIVTSAVCAPSRGCMMSGQYPHQNGAFRNNIPLNRDTETFAHVLQQNGWDTAYMGKWHLDTHSDRMPGWVPPERGMGFSDNRYMWNRGHYKKVTERPGQEYPEMEFYEVGDEKTYTTDWLKDKTIDYLRQKRSNPFCLMVSVPDPHTDFRVREPYASMFDPDDVELPESFSPDGRFEGPSKKQMKALEMDPAAYFKWLRAGYFGMVKLVDDCVGEIIDELKAQGIYDNTIVIFVSDHGAMRGEHNRRDKGVTFETAYRVPFIVRWPGNIKAGLELAHPANMVDFKPTLLGLLGLEGQQKDQGADFSGLLRGKSIPWEDETHIEYLHSEYFNHMGIVTRDYFFAVSYDEKTKKIVYDDDRTVLFDRKSDPEGLNNLYRDPACADLKRELVSKMLAKHKEIGSPQYELIKKIDLSK